MFVLDCTASSCSSAVELVLVLERSLFGVLAMMSQASVISRILNVINVRYYLMERYFPNTNL